MKTIVIGAGPAGLSCAYHLIKKGHDVEVLEAGQHVGGMAKSFDLWGQRVDLGPHRFFSKEKIVNDFFFELVREDYTLVNRQTRIYYNNRYFNYPLKPGNVLTNLPLKVITQIMWFYILQRINPIRNPENFEEWVINRFGKKLFEIFFKNYYEKLWGIDCAKIDADWASQRIKGLSLSEAIRSALNGNKGNHHKTLVEQFAYPRNGTGTLYERAAKYIIDRGGTVQFGSPVKKVLLDKNSQNVIGVELRDGVIRKADHVVSTMPLTLLVKGFDDIPENVEIAANKLFFRNTILVYLEIDHDNLFTDNWLYIHSPEVKHGRITNFRNWCESLHKGETSTILCMEFWCFENDALWGEPEQHIIKLAEEEIFKIDLIPADAKVLNSKVVKIPRCYPVYVTGYQRDLRIIIDYLNGIKGLYPIGRYGSFKYNNQDHSILMGILAADKIADNRDTDLWQINTDTDYQEEGKIKDILIR